MLPAAPAPDLILPRRGVPTVLLLAPDSGVPDLDPGLARPEAGYLDPFGVNMIHTSVYNYSDISEKALFLSTEELPDCWSMTFMIMILTNVFLIIELI